MSGGATPGSVSRSDAEIERMLGDMEFFLLRDGVIDREQLEPSAFIPDPHEIFPARVLAPSKSNDVLLLNYYMGTGKTHSATQVLVPMTERALFIEKSLRENALATGTPLSELPTVPKPLIVGNWSTVDAFMTELTRPMFGIVSSEEYEHLMALKEQGKSISDTLRDQLGDNGGTGSGDGSMAESKRDEYDRIMYDITKRIHARVSIYGFQRLFNHYFKGATTLVGKDEHVIRSAIESGAVTVEEALCAQLSDTLMIIDEPQTLYSASGWNSYGFMIDHILQNPHIHRLKLLMLSGTFINSSVSELVHLANLIRPKGAPRLDVGEYLVKERLSIGPTTDAPTSAPRAGAGAGAGMAMSTEATIYKPRSEDAARELIALFDGKVAFYPMPRSKDYPKLEFGGELISVGKRRMKWLNLVRCPASRYQWSLYNQPRSSGPQSAIEPSDRPDVPDGPDIGQPMLSLETMSEELREEGVARDIVIPPRDEWAKYEVKPVAGLHDVYTGSFLSSDHLRDYGAIPYRFVRYLTDLIGKGEKCCAYHRRVERGGIYQYAEILRANGFTHFGDNPSGTSMCYFCGEYLSKHERVEMDATMSESEAMSGGAGLEASEELDGRDAASEESSDPASAPPTPAPAPIVAAAARSAPSRLITSHPFRPASFAILTGRQTQLQRQRLLDVYNSPINADASRIMCIMISSVGEKGMTLLSTNHMLVLDSIPNVSLLKQIVARVARHSTHKGLPPDKQWVRLSVMAISPPTSRASSSAGVGGVGEASGVGGAECSREEFRYYLRELNDKHVGAVWGPVQRNSINCPLLTDTGARAGFGKGDWESGEIVCRYRFPSMNVASLSHYNAHYYAADVSAAIAVIMHVLNTRSPGVYLSEMENIIRSNTVRIVPWSTAFVSKEVIADAVRRLVKEKRIELLAARPSQLRVLSKSSRSERSVDSDPVIVRYTPGGIRALSIITRVHSQSAGTWLPAVSSMTVNVSIAPLIAKIESTRGIRERQVLMDALLSRKGYEEIIRRQFTSRGPLYDLLLQLGMIVWEGDPDSVATYAKNRLRFLDSIEDSSDRPAGSSARTLVPIGFIIGPEFHRCPVGAGGGGVGGAGVGGSGGGVWSKMTLPIAPGAGAPWKITGILSVGSGVKSGRWQLRFKIRPERKAAKDLRTVEHGMACYSTSDEKLRRYAALLGLRLDGKKTEWCAHIERTMLERQLREGRAPSTRYLYTPFESPV